MPDVTDPTINEYERDEALAEDPSTPPDVLDAIARKPVVVGWANDRGKKNIGWAREKVAANPSTGADTLTWLSTLRNDVVVLSSVLRHPNTPPDILENFTHAAPHLLKHLVQNPAAGDTLIVDVVRSHPFEHGVAVSALNNRAISEEAFDTIAETLGAPWAKIVAGIRAER